MRTMRITRTAPLALIGGGLVALAIAFSLSGASEPALLDRTGPVVIWGLPVAKFGVNLAAAVVIGALLLSVTALVPGGPAQRRALALARASALVWTACAAVVALLTFQTVANLPLLAPDAGDAFATFFTGVPLGRATVAATVLAATAAVLTFTARSRATLVVSAAVALAGTVPLVLNSHAAGSRGHADSTVAIVLHVLAASVWVGGLLVLIAVRSAIPADQRAVVVRRYSSLALASFVALAVSGTVGAWATLGSWQELLSPYGALVLGKTAALSLLFACGAAQRLVVVRALDRRAPSAGRHFAALVVGELAIMGAASGVAAALARTTPPASPRTGVDGALLPEFGVVPALTQWRVDPLWLLVCGAAVVLYLGGIRRLRRRGESWPALRTASWLGGAALLLLVTNGGLHVYQGFLLSAHAATQAILLGALPLLLVGGAPGTLIERTVESRRDGTVGALEATRAIARPIRWISTRPLLPTIVLALALAATLASPLQRYAALTEPGYAVSVFVALAAGIVFASAVVPAAGLPRGDRFFALAGAAIVFGAYGAWVRAQAPLLEEVWFRAVGNPWGDAPSVAPEWSGPLLWGIAGAGLAVAAALVARRGGGVDPGGVPVTTAVVPAFAVATESRADA